MKAIVCTAPGGPEVLAYTDVEEPDLKKGHVMIRVKATALNGADQLQMQGKYPPPEGASQLLGLEASGQTIAAHGVDLSNLPSSRRVIALLDGGGYAQRVVVPEGQILHLPDNLSYEQGAAIPEVWITAFLELVLLAGVKEGDKVLIHAGASGVGSAAIQIAKDKGAKVFVTAGSKEKLDFCKELGADVLINYKEEDFVEVVKRETDGTHVTAVPGGPIPAPGVDIILDLVGAAHFEKNLEALTVEGRLLPVGQPSGSKAEIDLTKVMVKRLRIIGSTLRARKADAKRDIVAKFGEYALPKFADGTFKPVVDRVFPLSEAQQAHEYMAAKKNMGKIILKVDGSQ